MREMIWRINRWITSRHFKKISQNKIFPKFNFKTKIDKINNNLIEKNKDEIILKLSKPDGNPFIGIESSNYNYSKKYFVTRFLKLYNLRKKLYFKKHGSRSPIKIPNEFKEILLDLKYFSKENNVNLYFIYLPEYKRYAANYTEENYDSIKNSLWLEYKLNRYPFRIIFKLKSTKLFSIWEIRTL